MIIPITTSLASAMLAFAVCSNRLYEANGFSIAPIRNVKPIVTFHRSSKQQTTGTALFQSSAAIPIHKKALPKLGVEEKTWWRVAAYTFVSSLFIFQNQINVQLIKMWDYLKFGTGLLPNMFRHGE